ITMDIVHPETKDSNGDVWPEIVESKAFVLPIMDNEKTAEFMRKLLISKGINIKRNVRRIMNVEVVIKKEEVKDEGR
ncbi:MAG TPA: hypothetical protein VHA52_13615, partial [Candidatus Babeliaceae bacterium]|nr:hypothetical protein [Candidatus Babeliaceae bacterium]